MCVHTTGKQAASANCVDWYLIALSLTSASFEGDRLGLFSGRSNRDFPSRLPRSKILCSTTRRLGRRRSGDAGLGVILLEPSLSPNGRWGTHLCGPRCRLQIRAVSRSYDALAHLTRTWILRLFPTHAGSAPLNPHECAFNEWDTSITSSAAFFRIIHRGCSSSSSPSSPQSRL